MLLFVGGLIVLASLFAGGAARAARGARECRRGAQGRQPVVDERRSSGKFSSALVVAELAVSCGLLIAAGLMIKSVVQLKNVPMPFAVDGILTARIDLPRETYKDSAASIRFYEQLLPRLQGSTGIAAATLSDGLPAAGNGCGPGRDRRQGVPAAERLPGCA